MTKILLSVILLSSIAAAAGTRNLNRESGGNSRVQCGIYEEINVERLDPEIGQTQVDRYKRGEAGSRRVSRTTSIVCGSGDRLEPGKFN